ncbi:ATP-binding protein, partial [Pseudomonas aeruginosa]|uniref:ATP-binding protein n=1 Tax=Pseudomonas aeruginosa TaxID=287 RepID=UPI003C6DBAA9
MFEKSAICCKLHADTIAAFSSSARGKIRIQTWQYSDSQQAISIEDNGCGIDLSLQKKIFDPFFT